MECMAETTLNPVFISIIESWMYPVEMAVATAANDSANDDDAND